MAEVYRAGIEAVPSGQMEAARSLGMSHGQSMRHVIVPQAIRKVIPPLLNDFIALMKDTSLVSVLGAARGRPGRPRHPVRVLQRLRPDPGSDPVPDRDDPARACGRRPDRTPAGPFPARPGMSETRPACRRRCRRPRHRSDPAARRRREELRQAQGARRRRPLRRARRGRLRDRALGLGQEHPAALHQPAGASGGRADPARGQGDHGQPTAPRASTSSAGGSAWSSSSSTCSRT